MTASARNRSRKRAKKRRIVEATTIGWREYVCLPDLGVDQIKAKVDTGARTSALHAWNVSPIVIDGDPWVAFEVHPLQRNNAVVLRCQAPLATRRTVMSSSGHREDRYVIKTPLRVGEFEFPIELTLTNRDAMGFRLLLGRTAVRRRFVVNPGRSYLLPLSREEQTNV